MVETWVTVKLELKPIPADTPQVGLNRISQYVGLTDWWGALPSAARCMPSLKLAERSVF